jgi:two-component system sensor histidine kinase KdpD
MEKRPDPDKLLKKVQAEEEAARRGKLKLFFGANAGVGKTYAMLESAQARKKEGWDVVAGIVETHGRPETAELLEGLEILPRRHISYKGVTLQEFDLDAALARRPTLILIDELAHTNAPGSRHAKRWQDVEELLDAGISVYTTLNVQHWESLNDVVAQITNVLVRETVPDTFLERAHELELVDIAPEDLLKRLKEGKVYCGDLAGKAADNFFQPGNLIALRELALRHTAERVDIQMHAFKEEHAIHIVWPAGERLMVAVSPSPMSARLVRATHRLATRLHARWFAASVETPALAKLAPEDRAHLIDNLHLAETLGAETVTLSGQDVAAEILDFARKNNVTKIVIGKPAQPRWKEWFQGSVVNQLARRCGDIDLYVISGFGQSLGLKRSSVSAAAEPAAGIIWAVVTVIACTIVCWPLFHLIDRANLAMIYLLGVTGVAYWFGRRASFVAAIMGVMAFDFFFVPPYFTLAVTNPQYVFTFGVMFAVAVLIGTLTSRLRFQSEQIRKREERTRVLYRLSRELSETPDPKQLLDIAQQRLSEFYRIPLAILAPGKDSSLEIAAGDSSAVDSGSAAHEYAVADWVYEHGQTAGAGTDTLSGSGSLYVPLKGIRKTMGILALRPADVRSLQEPEQLRLLETFAREIGGALESTKLTEAAGRAEMQMELLSMNAVKQETGGRLQDSINEKSVVWLSPGQTREQIIRKLIAALELPNSAQSFDAVMEREKVSTTDLGSGLAMPHARLAGIAKVKAALGISKEGPVHVWVLFFGPQEDPKAHLAFLARVAGFFQATGRIQDILKLQSAQEVLDYIRHSEETGQFSPS